MSEEKEISCLIRMPDVVLDHILSYLTYDGIAKSRIVCRRFNNVGQQLLNRGFYAAVRLHAKCSKEVKSQLPRRESQRPTHPLARHNNILHAIETRLSLLKMTYCKYIQFNACCFIPGKVVDELFRVLRLANDPNANLVPHEVLTELRDISSMAMDYFEEKISPTLHSPSVFSPPPQSSSSSSSSLNILSSPFNSKVQSLASSSRSPGATYDALDASMHDTLSSLSHCFGEPTGAGAMIGGSGSSSFFPFSDDLLTGEMKNAIDNLIPSSKAVSRSGLSTPTQLVPVPAETLKALVQALRETRGRKSRADRHLAMMQTKLLEVSRKVQDQERTISEQSRLLAEHSARFSSHSRTISEIINHSVTAEVVDVDDGSISLLSIPDYDSDVPEYGGTERGFVDGGIFRCRDAVAAVGFAQDTRHDDDSLDPKGSVKHQSMRMRTEGDVLAVGTKKRSKEEEEQRPLCQQSIFGKIDSNVLKSDESHVEVRDTLNVTESTPHSGVDNILRSSMVTGPMTISKVLKKMMETESTGPYTILDCNLPASTAAYRANVVDGSRPSTSKERSYSLPRRAIRPRIGRPLKGSTSLLSAGRRFLNSKSLTTLLSSLVNFSQSGEAATPSSINTLTKGQRARFASHLKRLQSTTSRIAGRRRYRSRGPASATTRTPSHERPEEISGPMGHPSRSRSTAAIHPTLLKTPDGRIIVMRQRSTGGGPGLVRSVSNYSNTESAKIKFDPRQQIYNPRRKVYAPGCSLLDFMGITPTPEEALMWQLPSFSEFEKQHPGISFVEHQKSVLQKLGVHISDDDESEEEAAKAKLPSTLRVTGEEGRKRKLGIVDPPVASANGLKYDTEEDCRLDSTTLDSSASSDAKASTSGVAVITSEEESDDHNASPILKRPRVELLNVLKKN